MTLQAEARSIAEVHPIGVMTEEATQVLIREARRRQRRRRLVIVGVLVLLALTGWITARAMSTDGSVPASRPMPPKSPVHPIAAVGQFSGTWHVHTASVTIQEDGQGVAIWPGPLGPGQSEATAAPGHARLRVTSVSGEQAIVQVSGSSEPSVLPDGPARLTMTNQDLLYLAPDGPTTHSPFGREGLCGPKAAALTVVEQVAAGINCGA